MRVIHILGELNHSGAERMLACSAQHWRSANVDAMVAGMANGSHTFAVELEKTGLKVLTLPDARSLRGLRALRDAIAAHKPRLVHVHAERCFDLVSLVATTAPGVEAVVRTVHSNFRFEGWLKARRHVRLRLARAMGVTWVACSTDVAETERSYKVRRPVLVVNNWVDVEGLRANATAESGAAIRRHLGIPPDAPVVALIGNCGGAKNHEFVPRMLDGAGQPVHVLHVGKRRDTPEAERHGWRTLPKRHTAHHLGERGDVPALLAASNLLLLPSLYEGRPLVAMEAMCAGVPILASDVPGLKWLHNFPSARLLPLNPPQWRTAMLHELGCQDGRRAAAELSSRAQAEFGPEQGVGSYLAVYRSAIEQGMRPTGWGTRPS